MEKLITNNKGFSLLEVTVAVAVVGINTMALMHLYTDSTISKQREQIYQTILDNGRVIQKTLANPASCFVNLEGKRIGDELDSIKAGAVDLSQPSQHRVTNESVINIEPGLGMEVEGYTLITENAQDYVEVSYSLSENKKKNGLHDIKKRYQIHTTKNPAGEITNCSSQIEDIDQLTAEYTCAKNNGRMLASGECQLGIKEMITAPENDTEECKAGSRYKLVNDNGVSKVKCIPCTQMKKFARTSCEKKYKGMNWVNVCYYRSACEEDPSVVFGAEYYERGPTRASGGDTGSKNNCHKKRLPCVGEGASAGDTILSLVITAEERAENAVDQAEKLKKYYEEGNLEDAHEYFNYLNASVNAAVKAAYEAQQLAGQSGASSYNSRAKKAEEDARQAFDKGFILFR